MDNKENYLNNAYFIASELKALQSALGDVVSTFC